MIEGILFSDGRLVEFNLVDIDVGFLGVGASGSDVGVEKTHDQEGHSCDCHETCVHEKLHCL